MRPVEVWAINDASWITIREFQDRVSRVIDRFFGILDLPFMKARIQATRFEIENTVTGTRGMPKRTTGIRILSEK